MTIKITGSEFKRFYSDEKFWPEDGDIYHEDVHMEVNGVFSDGIDVDTLLDTDIVTLKGGFVLSETWEDGDGPTMEEYFKQWRESQNIVAIFVECDTSVAEAVKAAIIKAGGKIL